MTDTVARPNHPALDQPPLDVRARLAGVWTATMFVVAFVDLFSLYRHDVRADLEAGELGGFAVDDVFLTAAVVYVAIPSLMIAGAALLPPRVNRATNLVIATLLALTIVAGAVGERGYYVLGSAIELALLAVIVHLAWRWPIAPATT